MKNCRSQSGVALVITLIMLSVITIIAVAFLALTQRERASLSQTLIGTEAEAMASTALERAKSQILADMTVFLETNMMTNIAFNPPIITHRLALGPDFSVSVAAPYAYTNPPNMRQRDYEVLTNLLFDAPPPVFSTNNRNAISEHVHYLDLNRNGRFEPSGIVTNLDANGQATAGEHYAVGDPQWIGVTARPNEPHSGTNRYTGRIAFMIVPAGRALDMDFIHNRARNNLYNRNQGHGSWELNLAAFLSDLNPDAWRFYNYNNNPMTRIGDGFVDARQILDYRYANQPLLAGELNFDPPGAIRSRADAWLNDGIDQYADGSDLGGDTAWSGSPNPQHFFSVHDFLKQPASFATNLMRAGNGRVPGGSNSFNSETFYRMLAQLGTDTVPEKSSYVTGLPNKQVDKARINLNYANTNDATAAGFIPWTPESFFHTVADRLLRDNNLLVSVTNLQLYPQNQYTPAVHRILQMTLNILDATTTNKPTAPGVPPYPYYPTVLQPLVLNDPVSGSIKITGYQELKKGQAFNITNFSVWRDLSNQNDRNQLVPGDYVYGVPVLIGAKKGYPNFNEFVFQSDVQMERKIQVLKPAGGLPNATNQMFLIGVSNSFGLEAWNSYASNFPRRLEMIASAEVTTSLSCDDGFFATRTNSYSNIAAFTIPAGTWRGRQFLNPLPSPSPNGLWTNDIVLDYKIYENGVFFNSNPPNWNVEFPAPTWVLSTTNRFRFFLFDDGHLVDAVGLAPIGLTNNLTKELAENQEFGALWRTNRNQSGNLRDPTLGVKNQLAVSQGMPVLGLNPQTWQNYGNWNTKAGGITGFKDFLTNITTRATNMAAPFTPQVKIYRRVEWRANDPLVHYLDEDLRKDRVSKAQFSGAALINAGQRLVFNLNKLNPEYNPWGGPPGTDLSDSSRRDDYVNGSIIDPLVRQSDDWEFPTNKFPTIGWLGRVHRGTPWQTIYFKPAPDPQKDKWKDVHYEPRAHPTNDWRLADIFTVAQHPNASRGRLSVNQTNLAAWSALLSGIEVTTLREVNGQFQTAPAIIQPAAVEPYAARLVEAINTRRSTMTGEVFSSLSEFLAIRELTVDSPYLTAPYVPNVPDVSVSPLRDRDYEAIPEKILSLIKPGEPRFVIYAFGQSLRPAPQSVLTGGPYRGLCVNYEVTGELAARAVVRVELDQGIPPAPRAIVESFNILPPD